MERSIDLNVYMSKDMHNSYGLMKLSETSVSTLRAFIFKTGNKIYWATDRIVSSYSMHLCIITGKNVLYNYVRSVKGVLTWLQKLV